MKIILSARRFALPLVGGVDVYAERLGNALQRMGHEVGIFAFDDLETGANGDIRMVEDGHVGKKIWRFRFAMDGRPKQAFDHAYDPQMGQVLRDILRKEKPDLLIVLNFYLATLAIVEVAHELGIPIAHIATDFIPICRRATFVRWDGTSCSKGESIKTCTECFVSHHPLGRLAAKTLARVPDEKLVELARGQSSYRLPHPLAVLNPYWKQVRIMHERLAILGPLRQKINVVLVPTQFTRRMFVANGFQSKQVHLLPFAVEPNHPLASVQHSPAGHIRFLFVGRLQPYKGTHLLIEAFNRLDDPRGATLTIYGAADGYETYFQELQKVIDANPRIFFKGSIPPDQLGQAFAEADYFVLPSTWHENSPLILLDALQSKTPVIASEIGGVTDVITHGVNGLLFARGDSDALRQLLQQSIRETQLLEELRAGVDLPTIDDYATTLLDLCRAQPGHA